MDTTDVQKISRLAVLKVSGADLGFVVLAALSLRIMLPPLVQAVSAKLAVDTAALFAIAVCSIVILGLSKLANTLASEPTNRLSIGIVRALIMGSLATAAVQIESFNRHNGSSNHVFSIALWVAFIAEYALVATKSSGATEKV